MIHMQPKSILKKMFTFQRPAEEDNFILQEKKKI